MDGTRRFGVGILNETDHARNRWFELLVSLGVILGVVLLGQTVTFYYYVSKTLVHQEGEREVDRKIMEIEKAARADGRDEPVTLLALAEGIRRQSPDQIAWVRILNVDGRVLAKSGSVTGALYTAKRMQESFDEHQPLERVLDTASGKLLVTARPLITPPSPQVLLSEATPKIPEIPQPPLIAEMALRLDSMAASLPLRVTSIIGCLAALALVVAMILIGLRFGSYLRGKRLAHELELARDVQLDLLPSASSIARNLEFAGECIPAWQVGGDFYDVFSTDDEGIALVLGDVAGKGLSAALLASLIQGAIRAVPWISRTSVQEQAAQRLNELLCARSAGERYASLFWCQYDPGSSVLSYINAGHLPPMLIATNPEGGFEINRLEEGGPVLGLLPDAVYYHQEVLVTPGSLLVLFSDGVTEATDVNGEEFGDDRLLAVILRNWDQPLDETCKTSLQEIRQFVGEVSPHHDGTLVPQDDRTLVVVRLHPAQCESGLEDVCLSAPRSQDAGIISLQDLRARPLKAEPQSDLDATVRSRSVEEPAGNCV